MGQPQVVIVAFQIHKGQQQGFLDGLPQDAGHFIPVHLHEGGVHLNLVHSRDTTILLSDSSRRSAERIQYTISSRVL